MATFQFGARIKRQDQRGRDREVGQYALHVQCAWRIARGDRVAVGSRDLHYPADYREDEDVPEEFDWDHDPNRRTRLLAELFEGAREFVVQQIDVGDAGSLHFVLSDGFSMDVLPYDSLKLEHWRLFEPGKDQPHFVFTGAGIES